MGITKTSIDRERFLRPSRSFPNARSAFKFFLQSLQFREGEQVLLPAYIGWSSREGSGVFDPVAELRLAFSFYRLNERLQIDLEDLNCRLRNGQVKLLVVIHYFGYVDPSYEAAIELARQHGAWVLEDEAHALLTDCIGGIAGRLGDACIYSLHKMLPISQGGVLVVSPQHRELLKRSPSDEYCEWGASEYDLLRIAQERRNNAMYVAQLLPRLADHATPLWADPRTGEVPQTFPILILRANRDELYRRLNDLDFGVVSLYHTMISQISEREYPNSHAIARTILNLPVHQDVTLSQLDELIVELEKALLQS